MQWNAQVFKSLKFHCFTSLYKISKKTRHFDNFDSFSAKCETRIISNFVQQILEAQTRRTREKDVTQILELRQLVFTSCIMVFLRYERDERIHRHCMPYSRNLNSRSVPR